MLAASLRMLNYYQATLNRVERRIKQVGHELFCLFISLTILLIAFTFSDVYFLNVIPLICVLLLYLSARQQLRLSEILAWLWLLPLLLLIVWGAFEADSMSFSKQMLNAQIARVELFILLSAAYYWYKRYYPAAMLMSIAFYAQLICFFMLPLLFIPKVLRDFSEYIAIALWFSTFISIAIGYVSQHRLIRFETLLLTYSATVMTALLCLENRWQGLVALAFGLAFMLALSKVYQGLTARWQRVLVYAWYLTPYYFALTLVVIVQTVSALFYPNWAISAVILCGYLLLALEKSNRLGRHLSRALKHSYHAAYALVYLVASVPALMHSQTRLLLNMENLLLLVAEVSMLMLFANYMIAPRLAIRAHQARLPFIVVKWIWHTLLIGSYLLWTFMLGNDIAAIASPIVMVIHASILMFISLRPNQQDLLKLAGILFTLTSAKVLLIDMASFQLVQKVIAFIVIGCILLFVAYFYQRNKNDLQSISE